MEILSTLWQIVQTLLLIIVIIGSVATLVAILHPLRFDLKLRGSVKGQRAEVWFVYLFRLFKIGVIATPHTQDVVVSFMGWKKRLERSGRKKPEKTPPPVAPPETPSSPEPSMVSPSSSTPTTPASAASGSAEKPFENTAEPAAENADGEGNDVLSTTDATVASPATPAATGGTLVEISGEVVSDSKQSLEEPTKPAEPVEMSAKELPPQTVHTEAETIEPVTVETGTAAPEIDSRPIKPLSEVEAEYKAAKEAGAAAQDGQKSGSSATASLKQTLRRFKRDASRRFKQFKGYARLFRLKWRALSPVFKRFWQRGKRGFGLPRIDLLLRYALHEPYLTGMCHGTLAVASGMAGQFGINFVPVPQFGAPMLYSRANVTAVVRPWRLLYATAALLFEKQLYKELWQLFKWYRGKKQH